MNEKYVRPALDMERRGEREAAINVLRAGRGAHPKDGYLALILGEMLARDERPEEAEQELRFAVDHLPKEEFRSRARDALRQISEGEGLPEPAGVSPSPSDAVRVGLVGCARDKLEWPARAQDLYSKSPGFREALRRASSECDEAYVVSGRFGLVGLDDVLSPYDFHLARLAPEERRQWAAYTVSVLLALRDGRKPARVTVYAVEV